MTIQPPQLGAFGALPAEAIVDQLMGQETVGVGLIDAELRYLRINGTLAEMNRVPAEEHLGRSVRDVLGDVADYLEPLLRGTLLGTPLTDLDFSFNDEGVLRQFRGSFLPLSHEGAPPVAVLALVVETTGHSLAEAALRLSQERLQLALEGTSTGTFEWHIERDDLVWSPTMGELWGREAGWFPPTYEEYIETLHPADRQRLEAAVRHAVATGEGYDREFRVIWPEGSQRWMHSRVHVVQDAEGHTQTLVGIVSDITDRRRRELGSEYLSAASLALAGSLDVEETLRHLAQLAVPSLADWCTVHLVRNGTAERVAAAHTDSDLLAQVIELSDRWPPDFSAETGVGQVIRTGHSELYPLIPPELLRNAAVDDEHWAMIKRLNLRSAMVVPIVARGEALGAITFVYAESGREYDETDLAVAEELGRRAGLAIENARLHTAESEAARRLRRLEAVTDVALGHLDLDDLLKSLLARLREVMETDFAVALLLDDTGEELRVRSAHGLDEAVTSGVRVPLGRGVAGRIAASGRSLVLEDVAAMAPISPYLQNEAKSLAGVPLRLGDRVIGVLHVSTRRPRTFDDEDLALLDLVADRVARAISLARLYAQARDIAVTLQRSLLPSGLQDLEGVDLAVRYLPGQSGTEVGGDFYDAFGLRDGHCALAVGDVVGRGIRAAAGMGKLRAAVRAYAYHAGRAAEAIERLDELVEGLGDVSFATLALMTIDPETGKAAVCLAGHLPPVIRSGGETRLLDVPAGVPIGMPPAPREEHAIELAPGDLVLLYTDGLVERRDVPIDERLALLVSTVATGPEDPNALVDHVLAAMTAEEGEDDIALLAMRRT